jgi:hypothetical protein
LNDVASIRKHWLENGPPTHIAVAAFAGAWGVKLTDPDAARLPTERAPAPSAISIADLAQAAPAVAPGGDTLEASIAILEALKGLPT